MVLGLEIIGFWAAAHVEQDMSKTAWVTSGLAHWALSTALNLSGLGWHKFWWALINITCSSLGTPGTVVHAAWVPALQLELAPWLRVGQISKVLPFHQSISGSLDYDFGWHHHLLSARQGFVQSVWRQLWLMAAAFWAQGYWNRQELPWFLRELRATQHRLQRQLYIYIFTRHGCDLRITCLLAKVSCFSQSGSMRIWWSARAFKLSHPK
jgi:hypothetical protein